MTTETTFKALWTPSWHELDQSLMVGKQQKYQFFRQPPAEYLTGAEGVGLVFYNQLAATADCETRFATVVEMSHSTMGMLSQIDTNGLDYIFVPLEGKEVLVNAEENPGTTYEGAPFDGSKIDDWSIMVTLSEVSDPVVDSPVV